MILKYQKNNFTSLRAPSKSSKIKRVNMERSNLLGSNIGLPERLLRHACAITLAVPHNDVVFHSYCFELEIQNLK